MYKPDGERVYPVKDSAIVAKEQADYLSKIEKNKAEGVQALSTGEFTPFKGWSVQTSLKTFDTILELDPASEKRIIAEVVDSLRELAQKHQITAIYPGQGDNPPHVVLQPGRFTDITPGDSTAIQKWLVSNQSHLNLLSRIVKGLTFHHDTLVVAPNSFVCASKFDDEQGGAYRARRLVERMMNKAHGQATSGSEGSFAPPFSYYDIFHSSVMRLTEKAPTENLLAFSQEAYASIGVRLQENPIPVTVKNLYMGIATDYHRTHSPHLVLL